MEEKNINYTPKENTENIKNVPDKINNEDIKIGG